jgi:flap endonuclease-1
MKSLHGRKIAIDASMALYQFLIAIRAGGPNQQSFQLTNEAGETTSHIQGMFNRTIRYLTEGIKPVFVFDGKPPPLKSGELKKRRDKRQQAQAALNVAVESNDMKEVDKQSKRLVRASEKDR